MNFTPEQEFLIKEKIEAWKPAYEVKNCIGFGGFGAVYRLDRTQGIGKPCAVKAIYSYHNPSLDRKIENEIRLQYDYEDVSEIVNIKDTYTETLSNGAKLYLIEQELMDGSVADMIAHADHHKLPVNDAVNIMIAVCRALTEMERHLGTRAVHGDIKPANILYKNRSFDGKRIYKLSDFGCVYDMDATQSSWAGTEKYTLPGDWHETRDEYAMGISLMEMLGAPCPSTQDKFSRTAMWSNLPEGSVSEGILAICRKAASLHSEDRYQTAEEMQEALEGWLKAQEEEKRKALEREKALEEEKRKTLEREKVLERQKAEEARKAEERRKAEAAKAEEERRRNEESLRQIQRDAEEQRRKRLDEMVKDLERQKAEAEKKTATAKAPAHQPAAQTAGKYQVGSIIEFGTYEQNASYKTVIEKSGLFGLKKTEKTVFDGYEKAPIKWRVLECRNDRVLLLSVEGLEIREFDYKPGKTKYPVYWGDSTLWHFLNKDFIEHAFDYPEQKKILQVRNYITDESKFYPTTGEQTDDKVFLLTRNEVERYFKTDSDRTCKVTAYAEKSLKLNPNSLTKPWWLRSHGNRYNWNASVVNGDGSFGESDGSAGHAAVRPALWMKVK